MTIKAYYSLPRIRLLLLLCNLAVALPVFGQNPSVSIYQNGWIDFNKNGKKDPFEDQKRPINQRITNLLSQMTLDEKTCQLATLYGYGRVLKEELPAPSWKTKLWKDGIGNIDEHLNSTTFRPQTNTKYSFPHSRHADAINTVQRWFVEETRLGIPVDFSNEGIHGLAHEKATALPAPIAIGSTWNKTLIRKAGQVAATLKHFAVYSVPKGGRDGNARTDPHVSPRELHNMYLYPFRRVIQEAAPMGIMSSYNDWDGVPITASYYFLTQLLRKEFGFTGYVVSDSEAVEYISSKHHVADSYKEGVRQAVEAGLNVRTNFDMPDKYVLPVRELVQEGKLSQKVLDERVGDVLRVKFQLGLFDHPYVENTKRADSLVNNADARAMASQLSHESLVLLKNEKNLLPLDRRVIKNILVTGPLAADVFTSQSRYGPSNTHVISVLEGLQKLAGTSITVQYAKGCEATDANWPESELLPTRITTSEQSRIDSAVAMARNADVIIAVVGESENQFGESRSRTGLDLTGRQLELLQALYATGKPVVAVLINGQPLTINWPARYLPALTEAWCPGTDGGTAIANVLFGEYNPSGKLPVTFPKTIGQLELNFPFKPGSHAGQPGDGPNGFGKTNVYGPLYPFGHGLSYTTFGYSNLRITPDIQQPSSPVVVTVEITNTGQRIGDEVVQLYIRDEVSSVTVYETQLRGFERVTLKPGETKTLTFTLKPDDLSLLDASMKRVVEPGRFEVLMGSSSEDIRVRKTFVIQ